MNRVACLLFFVASSGFGCRNPPSDREQGGSNAGSPAASQHPELEETALRERCGVGFPGKMITPPGEVIQKETAQTKVCDGDECGGRALAMMSLPSFKGKTCAEYREQLRAKPIVDAWGAQARVFCNGDIVQAISAGRDGKLRTCDDLSTFTSFKLKRSTSQGPADPENAQRKSIQSK